MVFIHPEEFLLEFWVIAVENHASQHICLLVPTLEQSKDSEGNYRALLGLVASIGLSNNRIN